VRGADADDLVQEVLAVVVRRLPEFKHNQHQGAFRNWLRTLLVHRVIDFFRGRKRWNARIASEKLESRLDALEDPNSRLVKLWDREHDRWLAQRLLQGARPKFEPATWQAFWRVTMDEVPVVHVATELKMSVNAVYIAKSRVIAHLRELGRKWID
jgi:RNA polymerase sigma factor (sigma-70 family)